MPRKHGIGAVRTKIEGTKGGQSRFQTTLTPFDFGKEAFPPPSALLTPPSSLRSVAPATLQLSQQTQ